MEQDKWVARSIRRRPVLRYESLSEPYSTEVNMQEAKETEEREEKKVPSSGISFGRKLQIKSVW